MNKWTHFCARLGQQQKCNIDIARKFYCIPFHTSHSMLIFHLAISRHTRSSFFSEFHNSNSSRYVNSLLRLVIIKINSSLTMNDGLWFQLMWENTYTSVYILQMVVGIELMKKQRAQNICLCFLFAHLVVDVIHSVLIGKQLIKEDRKFGSTVIGEAIVVNAGGDWHLTSHRHRCW